LSLRYVPVAVVHELSENINCDASFNGELAAGGFPISVITIFVLQVVTGDPSFGVLRSGVLVLADV
jgi:hypothetical protein